MCAQKEAMKRQGTRMKTTSCQNGTKYMADHELEYLINYKKQEKIREVSRH